MSEQFDEPTAQDALKNSTACSLRAVTSDKGKITKSLDTLHHTYFQGCYNFLEVWPFFHVQLDAPTRGMGTVDEMKLQSLQDR